MRSVAFEDLDTVIELHEGKDGTFGVLVCDTSTGASFAATTPNLLKETKRIEASRRILDAVNARLPANCR